MIKNICVARTSGLDRNGDLTGDICDTIVTYDRQAAIAAAIDDWDHQRRSPARETCWVDVYAVDLPDDDSRTAKQVMDDALFDGEDWPLCDPSDCIDVADIIADRDRAYRVREACEDREPWASLPAMYNPTDLRIADLRAIAEDAGMPMDELMKQVEAW